MARKKQRSKRRLPEPADDHDRKLLADVERHGWHVIGVEEDVEGPAFSYSIGIYHTFGRPEVILFGLPVRVMHLIINGIGEEFRSGKQFEHLDESADVLEGYDVAFRAVERKYYREYLGYARWFYHGDDFPVLQCVWPDAEHRYPWHPEFRPNLHQRQLVLSDDTSWPFYEGKNRAVFTTKPVLQDGHPILLVTHDADGDWQFLCGTTNRPKDGQLVSLGCIYQRDPSIADIADLPQGWIAEREAKESPWRRALAEEE
jgi:hypothetical protein